MNTQAIELRPEDQKIISQAEQIANEVSTFSIVNQEQYVTAGEYLKSVKSASKQLDELRVSMTKPLDESKKRIMDFFRKPLDVLVNAEGALKKAMLSYQQAQDRIRREQEAKLQAEAEKKRQGALKKAEEARANGKEAKAEKYEEKAAQVVAPVLASNVEKVAGINTKKVWKFEVIDESLIPRQYLIPDLVKIGKQVRAVGDTVQIPGIRIYVEETIAAGGR